MKSNRKNIPCELKGEPLAVLTRWAGAAEYLYHIVKALNEAGVKTLMNS